MVRIIDIVTSFAQKPVIAAAFQALGPVPMPIAMQQTAELIRQLIG